jgi:hypothetical protein
VVFPLRFLPCSFPGYAKVFMPLPEISMPDYALFDGSAWDENDNMGTLSDIIRLSVGCACNIALILGSITSVLLSWVVGYPPRCLRCSFMCHFEVLMLLSA